MPLVLLLNIATHVVSCVLTFAKRNTQQLNNSGLQAFQQLVFPPQQMSSGGNVNRTVGIEKNQ